MSSFKKTYRIYIRSDDGLLRNITASDWTGAEITGSFDSEEEALDFLDNKSRDYEDFIILPQYRLIVD